MKTTQLLFLPISLLIGFSCNNYKSSIEERKDLTYIYLDSCSVINTRPTYRFLKLETTEDCLVTTINKIHFDDEKIFIYDKNKKIFVFDESGKFLNTVGRIGQGPDDHLSITDFYLDKTNKRICVYDIFKGSIFTYSYYGKLLEKKPINKNIFQNVTHTFLLEQNSILLNKKNHITSKYNFSVVSGKDFGQMDNFVPYPFVGEKYGLSIGQIPVTESNNQIFMSAYLSDTIYRYDPNTKKIVPDMVYIGKCRPMNKKDVEGMYLEVASDGQRIGLEKKLSFGINSITMTQKYLTFCASDYNSFERIIWNMETKKGYTTPSISSFEELLMSKNPLNFLSSLIASTDDAFVSVIQAENFIIEDWKDDEVAKKVAENTLDDDNPILVYLYFNE